MSEKGDNEMKLREKFMLSPRVVAFACCFLALPSFGVVRTNTINNGVSDWTLPSSYADTSFVPGPGDVVVLPKNTSVTVDSTDTDSFNLVSNLSLVCFTDMSSVLTFDIAEGDDVLIDCKFAMLAKNWDTGQVVKKGKGRLTAGDGSTYPLNVSWYYHGIPLRIEEGEWRCAQGINPSNDGDTRKNCSIYYSGGVEVWSNAVFRLASGNFLFVAVGGLWGDGLVTTTDGAERQFRVVEGALTASNYKGPSVFGGKLDEGVRYFSSGRVFLTGTNSTMRIAPTVFGGYLNYATNSGYTAVAKFGKKGEPSSIGTNDTVQISSRGGAWGYLGTGETTDKTFRWYPNGDGPSMILDGGAYGGLVLAGQIRPDTYGISSIIFTGSNTTSACEVRGFMQMREDDASSGWGANSKTNFPVHITKTGTGIWKFSHKTSRSLIGAVAIEEGVLGAGSLEEAGVQCALGAGTNLFSRVYAEKSWTLPNKRIDYAFELGGEKSTAICGKDSEGTFEYYGTNSAYCTTRPFALTGDGRIRNVSTNRLLLANVRSLSARAKTLTLDGTDSRTNTLADVTDAAGGAISLAKEGPNTWIVTGTNDIRGDIAVKAGTLILQNINGQPNTWFKWQIRAKHTTSTTANTPNVTIRTDEFGLFNAGGARVNLGLKYCPEYQDLEPGQVAYATYRKRYGFVCVSGNGLNLSHVERLFDAHTGDAGIRIFYTTVINNSSYGIIPQPENPDSWQTIMMRLADGAGEVASWDYADYYGTTDGVGSQPYNIKTSALLGSANGADWELLDVAENVPMRNAHACWAFDGRVASVAHTNCNVIASHVQGSYPFLSNMAGAVSVAPNATLECKGATVTFSKLRLDAAGAGTIRGAAFAANGEISVENVATKSSVVFEGLFDGCSDETNVAGWTLRVNGAVTSRRTATVRGGTLRIDPKGLIMTLR